MLLDEIDAIQNPALGATLIWRSVCGFYSASGKTDGAPMILAFLVLPLVFNEDLREVIGSTYKSSGIRKFESKFDKQADLLLSIQERAKAMLDLSRRSLAIGISTGLVSLTPATATVWPRSKPRLIPKSPKSLRSHQQPKSLASGPSKHRFVNSASRFVWNCNRATANP